MEEQVAQQVLKNFPWISLAIASVLSTTVLTAVALLLYPGVSKPERGWKFRLWITGVCLIATIVVVPMPVDEVITFAGIQMFVLNFLFIISGAVVVYTLVGYDLFEKRIGPWLIQYTNKKFNTQLGETKQDQAIREDIKRTTEDK